MITSKTELRPGPCMFHSHSHPDGSELMLQYLDIHGVQIILTWSFCVLLLLPSRWFWTDVTILRYSRCPDGLSWFYSILLLLLSRWTKRYVILYLDTLAVQIGLNWCLCTLPFRQSWWLWIDVTVLCYSCCQDGSVLMLQCICPLLHTLILQMILKWNCYCISCYSCCLDGFEVMLLYLAICMYSWCPK